ncbi:MAG: ATP-binding protein [Clostridia bacterium]|nr:ATP-binding protein [Clostridia bacterium]
MTENPKIPFNFTYFAMKLLGKNLYSNPWTAISEIVANGIDAGANNVYVLIDMRNKEKAIVEIFDDGTGMSFDDLSHKYTLIGRNKRLEGDNREGKTLGRKGIGKLAALYLSPRYYLYTKTEDGQSAWYVNTQIIKDSDIPALMGTAYDTEMLISKGVWNELKTGTLIHLSDVDLRNIGQERLKSLSLMLSDYYLDNVITSTISVCVIEENTDKIVFSPIRKKVNFDNMFGIFDNTGLGYKEKLQPKVYITKDTVYKEVDYPRETIVLDEEKYITSGKIELTNLEGQVLEMPYNMVGWIGIHSSLDNSIIQRNSPNAKRSILHPNALRLYVRGKLAVSNLMPYIRSVAAFAPYIEGEISFDILDDDLFEDTSTSNREGYSISDPRIKKLSEIVGKIINTLVTKRNDAGKKVNKEIKAIKERIDAEAEEERRKREEAEEAARQEKKKADLEAANRAAAERERDEARAEHAVAEERLVVLENNFVKNGEVYKHGMHLAVNFGKEIRGDIIDYEEFIHDESKIASLIMSIDRSAEKIERLPSYIESVNFALTSPQVTIDVVEFICEYIETKGTSKIQYQFEPSVKYEKEVDFVDIILLIENLLSNSLKAKATNLKISAYSQDGKTIIDFSDNGAGLNKKYKNNPSMLFNLGETTTTGGFGIGTFHMKEIVEKYEGKIYAIPNEERGLTIRVVF